MPSTSWKPALDGRSGPRYRAIADALADDIAAGALPIGSRLPTHRDLAHALGVTVGTVTRAYSEAERRGLVGGEVGRGTFVSSRASGASSSGPRDTLNWPPPSAEPGGSGLVDMTVVMPPQRAAAAALGATLREIADDADPGELLGYAPHAGTARHRAAAADWMNRRHRTRARGADTLLATGAQNAMAVALAAVARPGDVLLTESLTNYGIKTLATTLGVHLEGIPLDEDGLSPEGFDSACRRLGPRALYTVPTLHNPTGSVMPEARRREIAEIARRHEVTIIEDDVFGFLVDDPLPYQAIAPDIAIFVTSLSKSVASGLRAGFLTAPPVLFPRVEATIRALQYAVPPLPAEVACRWIGDGRADAFCDAQRVEDHARQALARDILPARCVRGDPAAEHLWLVLPEPWRRDDFVAEARRRDVMVTGADTFMVGRAAAPHAVRVSLALVESREGLDRGLRVLADLLNGPAATARSIL